MLTLSLEKRSKNPSPSLLLQLTICIATRRYSGFGEPAGLTARETDEDFSLSGNRVYSIDSVNGIILRLSATTLSTFY